MAPITIYVIIDEHRFSQRPSKWKLALEYAILVSLLSNMLFIFGTVQHANTAREMAYNVVSDLGLILRVFSNQFSFFLFTFGYVRTAFLSERARSFWIPLGAKISFVVFLLTAVLIVSVYIVIAQTNNVTF